MMAYSHANLQESRLGICRLRPPKPAGSTWLSLASYFYKVVQILSQLFHGESGCIAVVQQSDGAGCFQQQTNKPDQWRWPAIRWFPSTKLYPYESSGPSQNRFRELAYLRHNGGSKPRRQNRCLGVSMNCRWPA